jgi:molecular chaperone GrpE
MAEETSKQEETQPAEDLNTQTAESPEQESAGQREGIDAQIKELEKKVEAAGKLAEAYKDQLLRKAAEFENYKKRSEADYLNMVKLANERLISSLIPILDDFSRSLKSGREIKEHESFFKGVELIYSKFTKVLESHGLVPFESVGKPFDVEYHDALLQTPRSDVPSHTVVEEVERGYKLYDKVLRHAKVIVSTEAPESTANGSGEGADKPA